MPESIFIRNGHIIDPSQNIDALGDILIEGGRIAAIELRGAKGKAKTMPVPEGVKTIDATGLHVVPGFVDLHVHLREPGFEHKETIESGTRAAVKGGFSAVCCMPNTSPVNDSDAVTGFILKRAAETALCRVYPIGAITKGQKGEELAEIGGMHDAGCVGFSDDGRPVMNSLIMRRALEYGKAFGTTMISHAEDLHLAAEGVMHEGAASTLFGLRGIPAAAEEVMIARDIILAQMTGGKLHIAHVSTKGSVELIRRAKKDGVNITCETCPHYFSLTDMAVAGYNTAARVNPPLRSEDDVAAIKAGLADGTIDAIATDHAPHHRDDKLVEFDKAMCGISGIETAFALSLRLVGEGVLTMPQLVAALST
ncbi:MAG TPA: dihydroorotase, partial [Dissulfurispiraceae bacterium]|nr:dihydroorotase [Dissulfurispiraceae bacterium]